MFLFDAIYDLCGSWDIFLFYNTVSIINMRDIVNIF